MPGQVLAGQVTLGLWFRCCGEEFDLQWIVPVKRFCNLWVVLPNYQSGCIASKWTRCLSVAEAHSISLADMAWSAVATVSAWTDASVASLVWP